MRDLFRKRRMWRRRAELKDRYDVVIIGGGSHGLATAYYLAQTRDRRTWPCSRRATSARARPGATRRSCAPTTRRPRARASTTPRVKLYEGLGEDLNFNLLFSQNGHLTLAHSDRAMFVMANRAEVNRLNGIDSRLIPPDEVQKLAPDDAGRRPGRRLSDPGRALPPARRRSSATTRWSGASPAAPTGRRGDPSLHGGHRHRAPRRARHRGCRPNRGPHRGAARCSTAPPAGSTLISEMAGVPMPITTHILQACVTEPLKPFLDVVIVSSQMHVYISQTDRGEVAHGRGDRAMDDVPDAGHAELPAGADRATRSSCSPSSSARASCAAGPGCATSAPTTARSSARPRSRASTSARAGARTASRPRRSSARRWPSWSRPSATPDLIEPFALERFYEDRLVSELAAAAVSH